MLFTIQHRGACFSVNQFLFNTILTVSHQFFLSADTLVTQPAGNKIKYMFFLFVHVSGAAATDWNILVLFETVSLNSNKTCIWGNRHISDMYMEPAFPLVLEFPLLTGLQQSVVQLSSVHLLMLFCSCLVSGDPLGSSCFCARLRQKPYVSSGTIHQRKPSRICGGTGDNSGIKGGTDMEGFLKKTHSCLFLLSNFICASFNSLPPFYSSSNQCSPIFKLF